ncbi:MAG: glucose 1-dehydrogenase [Chloroflexi bacterium]|nr:glucose 1-dehydrogenase [Chloroflexota bacterium]MCY3582996.1 glucose 1-dehydrogenase [Chloroflexota bacterium]MCY3716900.1 glucose 1-dehydrogenase [Chloroflexota bacterium]MDE2650114.1 glucose 1-dehydrogenase [Chloroflexota bacterium]MXV92984.1 glucose 1-dehydrogenase [Chloroflexota bacterium]
MAEMIGKVALVTGAAHGIGRASALALAQAGAAVCVADIDSAGGEGTVRQILDTGGRAFFALCDVRQAEQTRAMVVATLAEYGRLDAAVNNAGIAGSFEHRLHEAGDEMLDAVLAVNLRGLWHCMKAELDAMLAQGSGAIVNMASVAGLIGAPKAAAYTASKHAVVGITKSAALDYARAGLRINAVCPAYTDTRMVQAAVAADPRMAAIMARAIPMGRLGTADEIAAAVVWLCSDAASFVTGHALALDGGLVAI